KDVIVAKSFLHFTKAPKVYSVSSKEMETIIWYPSLSGFIRQQAGRYLKNFYVIRKGVIPIDNEIFSRDICGKKQRCADVREGFYDPCGNEDTYFCKEYKASDFPAVILELPLTILELELPSEKTE
ncbi:6222_t:CDS:2, partial [Rhizophagus irregularis]